MRPYPFAYAGIASASLSVGPASTQPVQLVNLSSNLRPLAEVTTLTSLVIAQERGAHDLAVRRKDMKQAIRLALERACTDTDVTRMDHEASLVLHEAVEEYAVSMFIKVNAQAASKQRDCLLVSDMEHVVRDAKRARSALMDARYFDQYSSDEDGSSCSEGEEEGSSDGSSSSSASSSDGSPTPDNSEASDSSSCCSNCEPEEVGRDFDGKW